MSKPDRRGEHEAPHTLPVSWELRAVTRPEQPKARKDHFALYSRYSTTGQKATSIERQVELAEEYVRRSGGTVVRSFVDEARSSMSASRDGLDAMMEAAARREFGVLVVENVDRLARDLSILSTVFRRLEKLGIEMHDPGRGRLGIQDIAIQGLMGEQGRRLLLERTAFSRIQMAREGRVPYGRSYGYSRVPGQAGELVIDPERSKVVVLVFRLFLEGMAIRAISRTLNERAFAPPQQAPGWNHIAVLRLLQNPLYCGTLVYGRYATSRDPQTRTRTREQRPREEWVVRSLPHLRLVTTEAWDRVQERLSVRERSGRGRGGNGRGSPLLLAQRVRCPRCGGKMLVAGHDADRMYFRCGGYIRTNTCKEDRGVRTDAIEMAVVEAIGRRLLEEGYAEAYVSAYNEARAELDRDYAATRGELERRVAHMRRRLLDTFETALTRGFTTDTLAALRAAKEEDLAVAEAALAEIPPPPVWATVDEVRMTDLAEAIRKIAANTPFRADDEAGRRYAATFRELVERVDLGELGGRTVTFSVTLRMSSLCETKGASTHQSEPLVITGSCEKMPSRQVPYSRTGQAREDLRRLEAGEFAPCEAAYRAVAEIVRSEERFRLLDHTPLDGRHMAEVLVLIGLTGMPWGSLPECFGPYVAWRNRFYVLAEDGTLGRLLARLREIDGVRYGDAFIRTLGGKRRGKELIVPLG